MYNNDDDRVDPNTVTGHDPKCGPVAFLGSSLAAAKIREVQETEGTTVIEADMSKQFGDNQIVSDQSYPVNVSIDGRRGNYEGGAVLQFRNMANTPADVRLNIDPYNKGLELYELEENQMPSIEDVRSCLNHSEVTMTRTPESYLS
jgi:hypothetical protein